MSLSDRGAASSIPGSLLPTPLSLVLHIMSRVHWLWKWKRLSAQMVTSTDNLKKLILGHIVNFTVGDYLVVRIAAQVTLIAVRILDLGKQKVSTYRAYNDLYDALIVKHPLRVRVRLPYGPPSPLQNLLGPDHYVWLLKKKEALVRYGSRVIRCASELFKQMMLTTLCYMSVIEAFTVSTEVKNEAISQVFLNASRLLDEMSENKQHIQAQLLRHKGLIEQILTGLGSPCRAEQLISAVAKTMTAAEHTSNVVGTVWKYTEGAAKSGVSTLSLAAVGWTPGVICPDDPNPVRALA